MNIGDIVGTNKIIKRDFSKKRKYWICECQLCKNIRSIRDDNLKQKCRSCAAKDRKKNNITDDLTNKQFGNWLVLYKSSKPNYWHCRCKCGEERDVFRGNLTQGQSKGCGCTKSWGETQIKYILNKNNILFKTQYTFSDLKTDKNGTPRFDFAIFNNLEELYCLIEYDGRQHYQYDKNWKMSKENFDRLKYIDNLKNNYCLRKNIPLFRFNNKMDLEKEIIKIINNMEGNGK